MKSLAFLLAACQIASTEAFSARTSVPIVESKVKTPENFLTQALEYEGETPGFDVLEKTTKFAQSSSYEEAGAMMAPDYVFRGSIIGPINAKDVQNTQEGFDLLGAYPNIERRPFGFTIDPDNPFRCYYFERWEGTNTGDVNIGPITMKATQQSLKLPTHIMSLHFNREGQIRYACLSSPLDRFEGNSKGAGAVFGLLHGAGLENAAGSIGDKFFRLQQRLGPVVGLGRAWSEEHKIPSWWKSQSRGADPTDM